MNQPKSLARSIAAAVGLLAAHILIPSSAIAETAADRGHAVALLKEGARLLNQKEFAAALEKFRDAYRLVPSQKIQYNIALAAEGLDRPAEAMRAYRAYLDAATGDGDKHRDHARERIAALRARVTFLDVTADTPGATVLVDGADEGQLPFAQPLVVNPGPHQVVVQGRGAEAPWIRAIRGEAGGSVVLEAKLVVPAHPPGLSPGPPVLSPAPVEPSSAAITLSASPPAQGGPPFYRRGWFWGVSGAVVAVGAVAAVFLIKGGSTEFTCPAEPCLKGAR